MPAWIFSIWFKPALIAGGVLAVAGYLWLQSQRIEHWRDQAHAAEQAVRASEIASTARSEVAGVRQRVQEIVQQARSEPVVVDLVADPRISAWLDRVFQQTAKTDP